MKKKYLAIPLAIITLLSLALASCGSDSDSDDFTLRVGSVLPETGQLAFLGPPIVEAFNLAVSEINDADTGLTIEVLAGDSGSSDSVAGETVNSHIAEGVDVIFGAAASGVSSSIIDRVIQQQIVMVSPSNTAPSFTTYPDNGYYFRTAPPDTLQARLLSERIIDDGGTNVAILHRQDDYGVQLAQLAEQELESAGAEATIISYDQNAPSFEAEAQRAVAVGPDAVVVIGFDEGVQVLSALLNSGVVGSSIYVTDGLSSEELGMQINPGNPGVIEGLTAVQPVTTPSEDRGDATFENRFRAFAPSVTNLIFSSHSYDAMVIVALAALAADSTDASVFRNEINDVTRGGTRCITFVACADLIAGGENIDYDGISGPLEFVDAGEPASGIYEVLRFEADGTRSTIDEVVLSS